MLTIGMNQLAFSIFGQTTCSKIIRDVHLWGPKNEIIVLFLSQQLNYQCLESTISTHFNHSFLHTLAIKTKTCVMALLLPT